MDTSKETDLDEFVASVLEEEKKTFQEGVQTFPQYANALSHKIYKAVEEFRQSYARGLAAFGEFLNAKNSDEQAAITTDREHFMEAVENGASIWALLGVSFESLNLFYESLTEAFAAKQYDKVKDGCIFLTTIASDTEIFWVGLGIVLTKLQEYERAAVAFDQALQLDPNSVDAYLGVIHLHIKQKQFTEALKLCRQGLDRSEVSQELHALLSEAKEMLSQEGA